MVNSRGPIWFILKVKIFIHISFILQTFHSRVKRRVAMVTKDYTNLRLWPSFSPGGEIRRHFSQWPVAFPQLDLCDDSGNIPLMQARVPSLWRIAPRHEHLGSHQDLVRTGNKLLHPMMEFGEIHFVFVFTCCFVLNVATAHYARKWKQWCYIKLFQKGYFITQRKMYFLIEMHGNF